jgi:hypothetical protein
MTLSRDSAQRKILAKMARNFAVASRISSKRELLAFASKLSMTVEELKEHTNV